MGLGGFGALALSCLLVIPSTAYCESQTAEALSSPARYNVTWDTPSKDALGSMPLGNGETSLNAWVNPSGILSFYIGRTDSWGENGRLLKLGLVQVSLDPAPSTAEGFRQTLDLQTATFIATFGNGETKTTVTLWCDAHADVVHVEVDSPTPVTARATLAPWRTEPTPLDTYTTSDLFEKEPESVKKIRGPLIIDPDTLLEGPADRIGWYHYNARAHGPALINKIQGVDQMNLPDPLLHRTFGAVILAAGGGTREDEKHLVSPAKPRHHFSVYVQAKYPSTPEEWLAELDKKIAEYNAKTFEELSAAHQAWWKAFWERSWIHVTMANGQGDKQRTSEAYIVSRAYALQRFITACAGRGHYPIKFNGSTFTVPYPGKPYGADYRRWGPGYWWQNTRLPYYAMCASGDFEMMLPLFKMYTEDLMPMHLFRTRLYCGHGGAYVPECIYFWGPMFSETYGWTPWNEREDKLQESRWHKWEWVSSLELLTLMLDYYDYTQDLDFMQEKIKPTSREFLAFFELRHSVDESGKIAMHPSQSLETWWDCTNPMPEIAGMYSVLNRFAAVPDKISQIYQVIWNHVRTKLPELPIEEKDGVYLLAPAKKYATKKNSETPELYAVFPFRLVTFDKGNVQLGIDTLRRRAHRGAKGWRQDELFMTHLGLGEEAQQYLVTRASTHDKHLRFPAFWGPNYDWTPDQTHGGVLMTALQTMILQNTGSDIFLMPAWPKDWHVQFKLHAPHKTVIQGEFRDGEMQSMHVTPDARKANCKHPYRDTP